MNPTMPPTKTTTQVGTTHFQLRDHHPGGGPCERGGGPWLSGGGAEFMEVWQIMRLSLMENAGLIRPSHNRRPTARLKIHLMPAKKSGCFLPARDQRCGTRQMMSGRGAVW
ncbi:MAG: hypothetical protein EOP84_27740 [Verrucomicrobiaceae bacterium]|nr:MAG: hypothetical protein EOP84_27740 [Verrucomicrobiaceae bacterium]